MTQPIAGNQYFKNVENVAGQVNILNAAQAKVAGNIDVGGSVKAEALSAGILTIVPNDKELKSVKLQTPANSTWYGQNTNAQALVLKDTTTDFTFSHASTVVAVKATVTSLFTGDSGATLQLGVEASAGTASLNLINAADVLSAAVNDDFQVSSSSSSTNALGQAGAVQGHAAGVSNFVTVNALVANLTSGSADVTVWYYEN